MPFVRVAAALSAVSALAVLGCASVNSASAQLNQSGGADRGRAVFTYWCAPCHAAGPGHPGTQSLEVKYGGSIPAVIEDRADLTPDMVKLFVRQGVSSMPPFRKTEIGDADLDALAAYLGDAPAAQ
jgi:mono/diheme cytochrome c family protein